MSRNREKLIKVTPETIRRMVLEEKALLNETLELKAKHPSEVSNKVKEVGPSDYANSLAQCMDYYQACKIKEAKMVEELKTLQEVKRELRRRIIKGI